MIRKLLPVTLAAMCIGMPTLATAGSLYFTCGNTRYEMVEVQTKQKNIPITLCGRQLWMDQYAQYHADKCFRQGGRGWSPIWDSPHLGANKVCSY